MQKVKKVKSENIFPIIQEILNKDGRARITVTGMSMYPFLRENIDSVELSNPTFSDIHKGDIVMVLRATNKYVMHRVVKTENEYFYMVGDAQQAIEGPLAYEQIFAKVTAVWRKDKRIDVLNTWWRLLSSLWMISIPLRGSIFKIYRAVRPKLNNYLKNTC